MVQQHHLERLALGRSAFEDLEPDQLPQGTASEGGQQYDAKGRPTNANTEKINAEQRRAQNEVLALVGVVERKDEIHRELDQKYQEITKARTHLFEHESDVGLALELVLVPITWLAHQWPRAFLARVQIGYYDCTQSMTSILAKEWRSISQTGALQKLATTLPGIGEIITYGIVVIPFTMAVEYIVGELQSYIARQDYSRTVRTRLNKTLETLSMALEIGIDIFVLPMTFYATAQRLGLAPVLPLSPPLCTLLPWHSTSFLRFGWRSISLPLRSALLPAAALVLNNNLWSESFEIFGFGGEHQVEGPFAPWLTAHRNPSIDNTEVMNVGPKFILSPFAWLSHIGCRLRNAALRWAGWRTIRPRVEGHLVVRPREVASGTALDRSYHRSTALAQMPANFLAVKIEAWFARLLALPFYSFVFRSVAFAFMNSTSFPKKPEAILASEGFYQPFGGGPFGALISPRVSASSLATVGHYSNHLALALALDCGIDLTCFALKYSLTRLAGTTRFAWQRRPLATDQGDPE